MLLKVPSAIVGVTVAKSSSKKFAATNSPNGCSLNLTRFWKKNLSKRAFKGFVSLRKLDSAVSLIP